jgi:uncharacterized protein (DUF1810 family)
VSGPRVQQEKTAMEDPFNLDRFVVAQNSVLPQVLDELRAGEKRGHWIWFIFPQMKGLGHSTLSFQFGIGSLEEAIAFWRHPVLGPRLEQCTLLVNLVEKQPIHEILGSPDDLKFRSSMTLFARAAPDTTVFKDALKKYFGGETDPLTLELL